MTFIKQFSALALSLPALWLMVCASAVAEKAKESHSVDFVISINDRVVVSPGAVLTPGVDATMEIESEPRMRISLNSSSYNSIKVPSDSAVTDTDKLPNSVMVTMLVELEDNQKWVTVAQPQFSMSKSRQMKMDVDISDKLLFMANNELMQKLRIEGFYTGTKKRVDNPNPRDCRSANFGPPNLFDLAANGFTADPPEDGCCSAGCMTCCGAEACWEGTCGAHCAP